VPSGSVDPEPSKLQVSPVQVTPRAGVGGWFRGGRPVPIVNASVKLPVVGVNRAVSIVASAVTSRKPWLGERFRPEKARK
jgi:hypothetical protein